MTTVKCTNGMVSISQSDGGAHVAEHGAMIAWREVYTQMRVNGNSHKHCIEFAEEARIAYIDSAYKMNDRNMI